MFLNFHHTVIILFAIFFILINQTVEKYWLVWVATTESWMWRFLECLWRGLDASKACILENILEMKRISGGHRSMEWKDADLFIIKTDYWSLGASVLEFLLFGRKFEAHLEVFDVFFALIKQIKSNFPSETVKMNQK